MNNGCEQNLNNDPLHCGGCDQRCPANTFCVGGVCHCVSGYANCNGYTMHTAHDTDGCEVFLESDVEHCGACDVVCCCVCVVYVYDVVAVLDAAAYVDVGDVVDVDLRLLIIIM